MGSAVPFIVGGAIAAGDLYEGKIQSDAIKAQGSWEAQQNEFNAKLADIQAEDALARGHKDAAKIRSRAINVKGSQRASFAGQGVLVGAGTAQDVVDETTTLSEFDANTARSNAWREAFGYRLQAYESRAAARWARLSANINAKNTMIASGINAFSSGLSGFGKFGGSK